jgi:hypothetical protein
MPRSTFGRVLAALCLIAVAVCDGLSNILTGLIDGQHRGSTLDSINGYAAHPAQANTLMFVDLAGLVFPTALALVALLARPGSPRLAAVGGWLGVSAGAATAALIAGSDLALAGAARVSDRRTAAATLDALYHRPTWAVYLLVALAGSLAAFIILAIALIRAHVVPWPCAVALPLSFAVTVPVSNLVTTVVSLVLLLASLGACALRILRGGVPDPAALTPATNAGPIAAPAA